MTPKQQMTDWLRAKGACREGREWAEADCASLTEVWDTAKPEWLFWLADHAFNKRQRVALGAACANRVLHLMQDERSRNAVAVATRYGAGEATDEELAAAAWRAAASADAAYADDAANADDAAAWRAADAAAAAAAAWASDAAADAAAAWASADADAAATWRAADALSAAAAWASDAAAAAAAWASANANDAAWDAAKSAETAWQAAHIRANFTPNWSL